MVLPPQHIASRKDAHHPRAAITYGLLHLEHFTAGDEQQLTIRLLARQHLLKGPQVCLAQQILHHLLGHAWFRDRHLGHDQGLGTAQHHIAAAQGQHLALQLLELLLAPGGAFLQLAQFAIPGLHITAQPIPLRLQLLTTLLQGGKGGAQLLGPGFHLLELPPGHGPSLVRPAPVCLRPLPFPLGLVQLIFCARQLGPTGLQGLAGITKPRL